MNTIANGTKQALFCYYDAFLTAVDPKTYKDALNLCMVGLKLMQDRINWIYKVKLDELGGFLKNKDRLVACGYRQEEGIDFEEKMFYGSKTDRNYKFINVSEAFYLQSMKYALESLKIYCFDSCDPVEYFHGGENQNWHEDKEGKAIDLLHYRACVDRYQELGLRKALKCGKKDLLVSKRNRTLGTMVSEDSLDCSNAFADADHDGGAVNDY
ncbi:hypothetical protein Tco_1112838 [Tanacetum coccineum]|uniref:Uncharacterized protein n=1 Tax=Tanacetum coccineum TaxID=301880 RepID=A0ABQ5IRX7_9ASTR